MLHLEIITPERVAYTNDVNMVVLPSTLGSIGILPHHISLFAQLVQGEVKIKKGNEDYYLAIGGGFVEVSREKVTVLVTRAVNAAELNESEIVKAQKEAQQALKQKMPGIDLQAAQVLVRQSIVDLHILQKRKRTIH